MRKNDEHDLLFEEEEDDLLDEQRDRDDLEPDEQEDDTTAGGGSSTLPSPHVRLSSLRPDQLWLTGGALVASGIADVAMHFDKTGVFFGLVAVGVVARHSNDILDHLVPGRDVERVRALTAQVVDRVLPVQADEEEDERHEEQAVGAKLQRLLGVRRRREEPEEEEEAQHTHPRTMADDHLDLGPNFQPHASSILSKRIGLFGIPGSGKTNGLTVFLEELGRLRQIGVPFVLADTEGEYDVLHHPDYLLRPYKAGIHNVRGDNAFAFGQAVLERGRQVILNLQSYDDDNEAALVMIEIIRGMRSWAEARPNDERATCMFILDEASIWLPQRQEESSLSKEKDAAGQTLLARLQQAFFGTVVRRGRKRGIGFLFATQRPADLDKRCISCDWLILFRQTFPNDLNKYAELGVPKDVAQALAPGEAMVIDPKGRRHVQQFRQRHSPDRSQSPGLASLERHATRWAQQPEQEEDDREEPDASMSQRQTTGDVAPPPSNVTPLPTPVLPEKGPRAEEIDLAAAIALWNCGYNSERKLMKAFHLTLHQARRLSKMIEEQADKPASERATD
ncbi:hypothetical protein KSF_073020 [Reticulibacter mediterranei]|uniref:Helicase HerA central domain-containing protein n=1 Tax=Reticulibacter mediterranei TaxID=2778369 RepID=A0A8J3N3L3_9CHLR|nr:DUF87 domain-containing protein [Reticulibacter mediterranei]GHO97254.1 hypothetical protein KSF_073020 [Reticulibacter mediterranei]